MAGSLSGTIMGSYGGSNTYQPYLRWSISQNIAENRSAMSVTFGMYKARANSQSYNINSRTIWVNVDGTSYSRSAGFDFRSAAVGSYNDIFTISNINIWHNADGSRAVNMSANHSTGISLGTGTVSGTAILLDIPRATTPSLSDSIVNLGDTITITTSAASGSYRHTLRYNFNGMSGTIASDVTSSTSWQIPKNFANVITTINRGGGEVVCETFNGSTSLGTKSVPFTAFIPDTAEFRPSIEASDITVSDTNSALYSKFGGHVQNKSQLQVSVSASGSYGSSIQKYSVTFDGQTYSTNKFTTTPPTSSGNLTLTATVTDSRGRTASASKNITVYPYTAPQITAYTVYRSNASGEADESGEYATLYMAYSIASVDGKNDRQYRILYKRSTDESYTAAESGTAQTSYEGPHTLSGITFSIDYQWDIRLEIWDYFTSSSHIAWTQTIDTEEVILDIHSSGKGISIGKVAEEENLLDVEWPVMLRGGITNIADLVYPIGSIYMSTNAINPSQLFGGTWQQISGRFLIGVGPNDANTVDNWGSLAAGIFNMPPGERGGEAWHTLSIDEMPGHSHGLNNVFGDATANNQFAFNWGSDWKRPQTMQLDTYLAGGGQHHNNMPPYLAVYMWERIA